MIIRIKARQGRGLSHGEELKQVFGISLLYLGETLPEVEL
jgi:hypothetical protein